MRRALEDEGDDHETRTPVGLRVVERTLAVLDAGAGRLTDIVEALLPRDVEISRPTLEIVVKVCGTRVLRVAGPGPSRPSKALCCLARRGRSS